MILLPLTLRQSGALRAILQSALLDRGAYPSITYQALEELEYQLSATAPLASSLAVVVPVRNLDESQSVVDDITSVVDVELSVDIRIVEG